MNAQSHTPGPWRIEYLSIVATPSTDGDEVCICTIEDDGGYEAPPEERTANAILIAAAPETAAKLAAARDAINELAAVIHILTPPDRDHCACSDCSRRREAIEKAKSI